MSWIIFAIATAVFQSANDVLSKTRLKNLDEYLISWSTRFFALPFLGISLFFVEPPQISGAFWIALAVGGCLNVLTTILYVKAIKHSDLSTTVPILAFTPAFLLITSPFMTGEFPTTIGLIGVGLVIIGSYLLNVSQSNNGLLTPYRLLLKDRGPRLMLIVAILWAITSNIDKIGVTNSSSLYWSFSTYTVMTIILFPIMLVKSSKSISQIPSLFGVLFPLGFISSLVIISQMIAISLSLVIYVIAVKRSSAILSVLSGYLFFKEKHLIERLAGTIIMILGVLTIIFS